LSWVVKPASSLCALLILVSASATGSYARVAERLSEVKKLYVDSLGNERGAAEMRERMVRRLRKSHDLQVVSDPKEADAMVRGTGRTWVTGHIFLSPRSHSPSQPIVEGFLSVEVVGKNDNTLWSYLVTPGNFAWNGIADDLARQLVSKLLSALKGEGQQDSTVPGSPEQVEGTLRGAGATFPAPIYQRWFELFQEHYPKAHVSYDAVGSAEGIQQLEEQKVDFGASEMPLSDEAMLESLNASCIYQCSSEPL
jgi:hypothetical protein